MAKRKAASTLAHRKRPRVTQAQSGATSTINTQLPTELWLRIIQFAVKSNKGAVSTHDAERKCKRLAHPFKAYDALYLEARKAFFEANEILHSVRLHGPQWEGIFGNGVEWRPGETIKPQLRRLYLLIEPQVVHVNGSYPFPDYTAGPEASYILRETISGCPRLESLTVHIRYSHPQDILGGAGVDQQRHLAALQELDTILQCVKALGIREKIVMLSDGLFHPTYNESGWCSLNADQIVTGHESELSAGPIVAIREALLEVVKESCEHGLRLSC